MLRVDLQRREIRIEACPLQRLRRLGGGLIMDRPPRSRRAQGSRSTWQQQCPACGVAGTSALVGIDLPHARWPRWMAGSNLGSVCVCRISLVFSCRWGNGRDAEPGGASDPRSRSDSSLSLSLSAGYRRVHERHVSGAQDPHRRLRREDDRVIRRPERPCPAITLVRPPVQVAAPEQPRRPRPAGKADETPSGRSPTFAAKVACPRLSEPDCDGAPGPSPRPLGGWASPCAFCHAPREAQEICSAPFRTWPVASRQGDRFVAKEQFGVAAGRKDLATPVLERERAGDPGPMAPTYDSEAALIVVKDARIPHQKTAGRCGLEFANGVMRFGWGTDAR